MTYHIFRKLISGILVIDLGPLEARLPPKVVYFEPHRSHVVLPNGTIVQGYDPRLLVPAEVLGAAELVAQNEVYLWNGPQHQHALCTSYSLAFLMEAIFGGRLPSLDSCTFKFKRLNDVKRLSLPSYHRGFGRLANSWEQSSVPFQKIFIPFWYQPVAILRPLRPNVSGRQNSLKVRIADTTDGGYVLGGAINPKELLKGLNLTNLTDSCKMGSSYILRHHTVAKTSLF